MTADNRFPHASDDPFDENDPFERAENVNVAQVGVRPAGAPSSVEAAAQRRVRMTGRGEHEAEPSFEEALAHAFDSMGPSEDAERRMLVALTAAEAKHRRTEPTARKTTKSKRHEADAITRPAAAQKTTPRRRPQIWKLAVPIAACLALLAGVGAWALGVSGNFMASSLSVSSGAMQNPGNALSSENAQPPAVGTDAENARGQGGSAGSGTDSSESTNGSSGGSSGGSGGSSGDASQGNLYIELSTGQRLRYALDDTGAARRANPALVGEAVESTFIYDEVGDTSSHTPCTVYAYADSNYPYAVRTEGNDFYYLAVEAAS